MFSTLNFSRVTVVWMAAAAMMMMFFVPSEAASVSKHSTKTHRRAADGAASSQTVRLQLDPQTFASSRAIRPLQNSSISPWAYNDSYDDSLFPHVQSEAYCLLEGCLDSEGQEDMDLQSVPIMHQVLQLRRVRSGGAEPASGDGYHYRLETRTIAVGCTCVRRIVIAQQ